ncbi:hypothetical protein DV708_17275 [Aeromonas veronii]|nr:hypothetical protein DV708_17275 [Aeromonas veronii]
MVVLVPQLLMISCPWWPPSVIQFAAFRRADAYGWRPSCRQARCPRGTLPVLVIRLVSFRRGQCQRLAPGLLMSSAPWVDTAGAGGPVRGTPAVPVPAADTLIRKRSAHRGARSFLWNRSGPVPVSGCHMAAAFDALAFISVGWWFIAHFTLWKYHRVSYRDIYRRFQ